MRATILGHTLEYDESAVGAGFRYLIRELDSQEAKVFFEQAYSHGSAVFEDHMGHKYKLIHNGGEYQLVKA